MKGEGQGRQTTRELGRDYTPSPASRQSKGSVSVIVANREPLCNVCRPPSQTRKPTLDRVAARLLPWRASSVKLKTEHGNRLMGELERANCGSARYSRARLHTDTNRANWQS